MTTIGQTNDRRSPQFSLKALLLVVTVCAIAAAWLAVRMRQAKRRQEAVSRFIELGGSLGYDGDDSGNVVSIHFANPTKLSDEDLRHVGAMPYLETLWLNNSQVTGEGLAQLRSAPRLRELNVNPDQISDAGIENLKTLPALQRLAVWGASPKDAAQVKKLEQAVPDVDVTH